MEIYKNIIMELHNLLNGNVIFVGSMAARLNGYNGIVKDIDIVLSNSSDVKKLISLGKIHKLKKRKVTGFVDRYYLTYKGILIDIFINNIRNFKISDIDGLKIKHSYMVDLIEINEDMIKLEDNVDMANNIKNKLLKYKEYCNIYNKE